MLIDYTIFSHPKIRIPGMDCTRNGIPTESAERIISDITAYIEMYEPRFLSMLLGSAYKTIIESSERIKNELTGEDGGLSPLACYVYFYYTRDHATTNTMAGERVKTTDNSIQASPSGRLVNLWNDMVERCVCIASLEEVRDTNIDVCSEIFYPINRYNL